MRCVFNNSRVSAIRASSRSYSGGMIQDGRPRQAATDTIIEIMRRICIDDFKGKPTDAPCTRKRVSFWLL
jgi:hypothetical protein